MNKDAKHLNLRTLFHCLGAGITALFSSFLPHLKSRTKDTVRPGELCGGLCPFPC